MIRLAAFLLAVCAVTPGVTCADDLSGRLVVGSAVYSVAGKISTGPGEELRIAFVLTSGDSHGREVDVVLQGEAGFVFVDGGTPTRVSKDIANAWRTQLKSGFTSDLASYSRRDQGNLQVYDSVGVVPFAPGVPSRVRLTFTRSDPTAAKAGQKPRLLVNRGYRISEIRVFSLAEWNNVFMEYVSLSLEFK
jgi:hypothetical protein